MKLLVNHKYEIANGCGEYITGVITKIGRTYIYLDNCSYWTGIADRKIGKYRIPKKDLVYVKEVH